MNSEPAVLELRHAFRRYLEKTHEVRRRVALKDFSSVFRQYRPRMEAAVNKWIDQARRAALVNLEDKLKGTDPDKITARVFNEDGFAEIGQQVLGELVLEIVNATGVRVMKFRKQRTDPIGTAAVKYARRNVARMVSDVSDETRKAIKGLVVRAINHGESVQDLAMKLRPLIGLTDQYAGAGEKLYGKLIEQGFSADDASNRVARYAGKALRERAETISRTETARATSAGTLAAYDQNGIGSVEWVWEGDPEDCPEGTCPDNNGHVFTIEEAEGLIPAHPRCTCAWVTAEAAPEAKPGEEAAPPPEEEVPPAEAELDEWGFPKDYDPGAPLSVAEAEKYAQRFVETAGKAYFDGMTKTGLEGLGCINETMRGILKEFVDRPTFFGTQKGLNRYLKEIGYSGGVRSRNYWGYYTDFRMPVSGRKGTAIIFNDRVLGKEFSTTYKTGLQTCVQMGFHKTADPGHVLWHEYGHFLGFQYQIHNVGGEFNVGLREQLQAGKNTKDLISGYARKNNLEAWSEAFVNRKYWDGAPKEINDLVDKVLRGVPKKGG